MATNYRDLSNRIKLLAHRERLRILDALRRDAECVCHLSALLDKPQPYVSQQLLILRIAGVIRDEKEGQNVFYRLIDDELAAWIDCILDGPRDVAAGSPVHLAVEGCVCPKCNGGGHAALDRAESRPEVEAELTSGINR